MMFPAGIFAPAGRFLARKDEFEFVNSEIIWCRLLLARPAKGILAAAYREAPVSRISMNLFMVH